MLSTVMKSTLKMPITTLMVAFSMAGKSLQYIRQLLTSLTQNASSIWMAAAREEVTATTCTLNPFLKLLRKSYSQPCISSILNTRQKSESLVRILSRRGGRKEEESIVRIIGTRNTSTGIGQESEKEGTQASQEVRGALRREDMSLTNGTKQYKDDLTHKIAI